MRHDRGGNRDGELEVVEWGGKGREEKLQTDRQRERWFFEQLEV
jgi:hypothetical protein